MPLTLGYREDYNGDAPLVRLPIFNEIAKDVGIPLDYWQAGVDVLPKSASTRSLRMRAYRELLEGDYRPLKINTEAFAVVGYFNYFADSAEQYRDFLSVSAPEGFPLAAIVDYLAYGLAIIAGADEPELNLPEDFFPAGMELEEGWTYLRRFPLRKEVEVHQSTGVVTTYELPANGRQLGRVIGTSSGDSDLVVVPAEPRRNLSMWGDSLYQRMADTVARLTLLDSGIDTGAFLHSNPILWAKEQGSSFRQSQMQGIREDRDEAFTARRKLGQIQVLGPEEDIGYAVADLSLADEFTHRTNLMRQLSNVTGISPTLLGDNENRLSTLSGTALRQTFIRTDARVREIIRAFQPYIQGEWLSPFDVLGEEPNNDTAPIPQGG